MAGEEEEEDLGLLFLLAQAEKKLERAKSDFPWDHALELQKSRPQVEVARLGYEAARLKYQAAKVEYEKAKVKFDELAMRSRSPRIDEAEADYRSLLEKALPKAVVLKDKFLESPFRVISTGRDAVALRKLRDLTGFSCPIYIENGPDAERVRKTCQALELECEVMVVQELGDESPNQEAESSSHGYRISTGSYLERKDDY